MYPGAIVWSLADGIITCQSLLVLREPVTCKRSILVVGVFVQDGLHVLDRLAQQFLLLRVIILRGKIIVAEADVVISLRDIVAIGIVSDEPIERFDAFLGLTLQVVVNADEVGAGIGEVGDRLHEDHFLKCGT